MRYVRTYSFSSMREQQANDKNRPGNSLLLVSQLLLLGGSRVNIAFVVIAILFLDIGQQVSSTVCRAKATV